MSDGRKNNGGHSTKGKAGRPPKADEQKLIETLKPLMPAAYKALESALKEEQSWAVKLAMEYFYGKPHQTVDNNIKVEEIKRPIWFDEE
jgi:hypothetical protein